jgi:hypothetical protein
VLVIAVIGLPGALDRRKQGTPAGALALSALEFSQRI